MTYELALDALGDPTRRHILDRLRQGPSSVAVLSAGLPISRPAVSQHLKVLKQAGLVSDEAAGARRIYRLNLDGLAGLRAWLDGFREDNGEDYQAEIQRQLDERRHT
jgi:DNA-binding transcriptional ArsR family regulator